MKLLHGLTRDECEEYLIRRMANFHETDFSKYGEHAEVVRECRRKGMESLAKEIEEYFA